MKKIIYYLCCILFFGSLGCSKKLDIKPESIVSSNTMWETSGDAQGAMYGMFAQLRSTLSYDYVYWGDYRSGLYGDGLGSQGSYQDMFGNTITREDIGTNWDGLYKTINDCNLILKYTPGISFDNQDSKNFILANAYFVRALCYYYCARVWGDSPIVLTGFESDKQDNLYPHRAPADSVYAQVAHDISQSISLFPNDDISSRKVGSRAAANMLKADFYLWMAKTQNGGQADLQKADDAVNYVLSNPNTGLSDSYASLFSNDENPEIIFALDFTKNEYEGGFPADLLVAVQYIKTTSMIENPIKVGSHQQWVCVTPEFQSFLYSDPNDTRAHVNVDTAVDPGNGIHFRWINKYPGEWTDGTRYFTSDIKIYRYAEAILFKAEIENALDNPGEAITQLNKIAKRAYGIDNYYSASLGKSEIDSAILNERLKEFAEEGKSWFDLIRFGVVFNKVASLKGKENQQNILLWPVNSSSINTNPNITQTPGYN